jgi:hypothetical protein
MFPLSQSAFLNNPFIQLGYFIKTTKYRKLVADIQFARTNYHHTLEYLIFDLLKSSLKYGSSFHEYFYYNFSNKSESERKTFATTGKMYVYQLIMNPSKNRYLVENKLVFLDKYKDLTGRNWLDLNVAGEDEVDEFIKGKVKVVLKNSKGQAGRSVKVIDLQNTSPASLIDYSKRNRLDLMEEFVVQHDDLMALAPESLNTIRIITQITNGDEAEIIGTIIRLGCGRETDNLSTDGIACPIDLSTGKVNGPGISFDITKPAFNTHPISGKNLQGFQIPFWKESVERAKKAALLYPQNRSVGWDVAVTKNGPLLIEGNHNWGARLWQMPVHKGLKYMLQKMD